MNHKPHYIKGDFLRIDDASGFIIRRSQSRKQWNGMIVDRKDWEAEQPQNYLRAIPDDSSVPDPRPEATDVFLGNTVYRREDGTAYLRESDVDVGGNPIPLYREE